MKLITKFLLVIACMTAGIVVVGCAAMLMIGQVKDDVEKISNDFLPAIQTLDALEIDVHKARAALLEMMVLHDDAQTVQTLVSELADISANTSRLLQHYKSNLAYDDEDRVLYLQITALRTAIATRMDTVQSLVLRHDISAAKTHWTALDDSIDALETKLGDARSTENQSALEHLESSRHTFQQSQTRALLLAVSAFSIGCILSIAVYQKITKPIQNLTEELLAFEKSPDLSIRFEGQSLSELEVISKSLNLLMDWVNEHAGQLAEQRDEIAHLANHDQLTGLPVWRLGKDRLEVALAAAHRTQQKVALMFIDLDGFKAVNDTFGHDAGDVVLVEVARRLQKEIRAEDTVARMGGDEFVVVLGRLEDDNHAAQIAARMIFSVAQDIAFEGRKLRVGSSIGIALYPENGNSVESLLLAADQAMYGVKRAGKNNFAFAAAS